MNQASFVFNPFILFKLVKPVHDFVIKVLGYGYANYKDFILGLLIGLSVAWIYHKFIGNKNLTRSYERLLLSKDETIEALKEVIGGRLAVVDIEKRDPLFFKRIRQYFRKTSTFKFKKK